MARAVGTLPSPLIAQMDNQYSGPRHFKDLIRMAQLSRILQDKSCG